jgi:hypothetical protein
VSYRYIGRLGPGKQGTTEYSYPGPTVASGVKTLASFFNYIPMAGTIQVIFNGLRLEDENWSVVGRDLTLNLDTTPYALEAGDVISAYYSY